MAMPETATAEKTYTRAQLRAAMPASLTGSYLAGRFAQQQKDWDNAYEYMSTALELADGSNTDLLDRTFLLAIGNGSIDNAGILAERVIADGKNKELGYILKSVKAVKKSQYSDALASLNEIDTESFGGYTVPLLRAWATLGTGDHDQAMTLLNTAKYSDDPHYTLHKALMHDVTGDTKKAEAAYHAALKSGLSLQETLLVANYFERNGKTEEAGHIYKTIREREAHGAFVVRDQNPEALPEATIASADDGLVFSLFSMAGLLKERKAHDSALIYSRMVEYLQPDQGFINIMLGDLLTLNGDYDEALNHYNKIKSTDPSYKMAKLRSVEVMEASGRAEDAIDLLDNLSQQETTRLEALTYIGDIHQRSERHDLALNAYDQAIDTIGKDINQQHWNLVYARGIAYEQLDNWEAAEKDLLRALKYQPENPAVLNYLGYSWVEKDMKLEQAMKLLKKAVALRPNDGFIADSYGWAFYKKGDYKQAVYWLERAIELNPEDATLNDHLGDAYWQTNRIKEARFQWKRAIHYARDPAKKLALKAKLKHGLITTPATDSNQEAALH
ncbi:MAG: tetratricopeptide repeat protein [Pseudomonadota bacterium]